MIKCKKCGAEFENPIRTKKMWFVEKLKRHLEALIPVCPICGQNVINIKDGKGGKATTQTTTNFTSRTTLPHNGGRN